ncbi:SDR family oxidoreductase, partial [Myxococcota bacterium]|nr:SDR family oxidoreductase [Myxococcota bacterium]
AAIESIQANVCDPRAIREAIQSVKSRYGAVHGVIHAAGVLDDDLLLNKTLEAAHQVLNPKVDGTLALWDALRNDPLDFFWLYSSVSAAAGLPGQSDYAAANAFLDAFAQSQASRGHPVLSIAWGPWRDVGMAAELERSQDPGRGSCEQPLQHPFLQQLIFDTPNQQIFAGKLGPQTSWLLDDHRLASGEALIPGTGFVEMARAAIGHSRDANSFELREVFLAQPLMVEENSEREVRVVVEPEQAQFAIVSREAGGDWVDHVRGEFVEIEPAHPVQIHFDEIRGHCDDRTEVFDGPPTSPHLRFGARWDCLKAVHFGASEAFAELELSEHFVADLDQIGAHPALLDLATGCAHALIDDNEEKKDFFVPMGYGRIHLETNIPSRICSHVRHVEPDHSSADVVFFQITLYDPSGTEIGRVDDFMLKRVSGEESLTPSKPDQVDPSNVRMFDEVSVQADTGQGIAPALQYGIRSEDAPALFDRLLAQRVTGQITVLPCDFQKWLDTVRPTPSEEHQNNRTEDPILQADLAESLAALLECDGVEDAWVTAHFDRPGERRLLGHVVFRGDHSGTISEVRKTLRKKLSSDLVPQNFNELSELPRLRGGGVDAAVLEDPFGLADDFEAPRSESEKSVAQIWQEVLGIDRVGLYDNFFDSGGHSLLAMRVIVRSEKRLGVKLNNAMMVLQTLEQIAAEVDKQTGGGSPLHAESHKSQSAEETEPSGENASAARGLSGRLMRAVRRTVKAD